MSDTLARHVTRGTAPLLVSSLPHTGTDLAGIENAARLALARPQGRRLVDRPLYDFAGGLGATVVRTAISRTVIDVNRDPSGASLYPGQATTELCPTDDLRRRAALSRRRGAGAGGDRRTPRANCSIPITPRLQAEIDAAARPATNAIVALRLPFDPLGRCRACSRARCRTSISAPMAARAPTRSCRRWSAEILRRDRRQLRRQRPLQGRLDHAPLRPARKAASTRCRWSSPAAAICASPRARASPTTGRRPTMPDFAAPIRGHADNDPADRDRWAQRLTSTPHSTGQSA